MLRGLKKGDKLEILLKNGTKETMYVFRNTKYKIQLVYEPKHAFISNAEFYYNGTYAGMMFNKYFGASFIQESIDNAKKERSPK